MYDACDLNGKKVEIIWISYKDDHLSWNGQNKNNHGSTHVGVSSSKWKLSRKISSDWNFILTFGTGENKGDSMGQKNGALLNTFRENSDRLSTTICL